MNLSKITFFLVLTLFSSTLLTAQKKPAKKSEIITVTKFKAPKLFCSLDTYLDSATISAEDAVRVVGMPLKIYDDKKKMYSISSYQFLYRKKGVTEDEEGKVTPTTSISSDRFKVTPLPDIWVNLIRGQVKQGEEFFFFDVIAKDAQGRVMYAPNLKLVIR